MSGAQCAAIACARWRRVRWPTGPRAAPHVVPTVRGAISAIECARSDLRARRTRAMDNREARRPSPSEKHEALRRGVAANGASWIARSVRALTARMRAAFGAASRRQPQTGNHEYSSVDAPRLRARTHRSPRAPCDSGICDQLIQRGGSPRGSSSSLGSLGSDARGSSVGHATYSGGAIVCAAAASASRRR